MVGISDRDRDGRAQAGKAADRVAGRAADRVAGRAVDRVAGNSAEQLDDQRGDRRA